MSIGTSCPRSRVAGSTVLLLFLLMGLLASGVAQAADVWVVPVRGTIEWGLAGFVQRAVGEAVEQGAGAILFEISTFGGRVDAATEIRDAIMSAPVPTIAYVTERAWSAGALIALAAEHLAMAPGSSIGAAEPRPAEEKTISAVRAEFEATAQGRGRDPEVAAAMVDQDIAIAGLVAEGKILTLSADHAVDIDFADFIAQSRQEVLRYLGYDRLGTRVLKATWAEKAAGFITLPVMSSLLLILGFAGLVLELLTPGFGVPGTIGIIGLVLFFGGRMIIGLAGWEEVFLFVTGFVLLLIEVFVIPGFGLVGLLGLASIFGSIVLSYASTEAGLVNLAVALMVTAFVVVIGWKRFRRSGAWERLVLKTVIDKTASPDAEVPLPEGSELVEKLGTALTPLRPAGIVEIDGKRVDAVTEGEFVSRGSQIQVISMVGNRVVVKAVALSDQEV